MAAGQDPVEERILGNIKATLLGINGAPTYNHTIKEVVEFEAWDDDLLLTPACMVLAESTQEEDSEFSDRQVVTLEFRIVAVLSKWTQASARQATSQLAADIKLALLADIKRGGFARDTHITRTERFHYDVETGPRAGIVLYGNVQFRHLRNDPYVQG